MFPWFSAYNSVEVQKKAAVFKRIEDNLQTCLGLVYNSVEVLKLI